MKSTSFRHNFTPTALKFLPDASMPASFCLVCVETLHENSHKHFMRTRSNQEKSEFFFVLLKKIFQFLDKNLEIFLQIRSQSPEYSKRKFESRFKAEKVKCHLRFLCKFFWLQISKKFRKIGLFVCYLFCITKMVPLTGLEPVRILLRGIFTLHYVTIAIQSCML